MPPVLGQHPAREGRVAVLQDAIRILVLLAIQLPGTEQRGRTPRRFFELVIASVGTEIRPPWAYSSVGLERTPDKREVGGSNPPRPTSSGDHRFVGL
jgi:hypothetical protein